MGDGGANETLRDLRPLFAPRSVAVVGASADTSKWGGDLAARLAANARTPELFFVNRRGGTLHGRTVHTSLGELPLAPELVIVATPAASFGSLVDEGLSLGVKAFVGIFAGLGEHGGEGRLLETQAARRIREEET